MFLALIKDYSFEAALYPMNGSVGVEESKAELAPMCNTFIFLQIRLYASINSRNIRNLCVKCLDLRRKSS